MRVPCSNINIICKQAIFADNDLRIRLCYSNMCINESTSLSDKNFTIFILYPETAAAAKLHLFTDSYQIIITSNKKSYIIKKAQIIYFYSVIIPHHIDRDMRKTTICRELQLIVSSRYFLLNRDSWSQNFVSTIERNLMQYSIALDDLFNFFFHNGLRYIGLFRPEFRT